METLHDKLAQVHRLLEQLRSGPNPGLTALARAQEPDMEAGLLGALRYNSTGGWPGAGKLKPLADTGDVRILGLLMQVRVAGG